ncbi:hypothetical protein AGLY_000535 [Aphis glycines]|uniref:Uncharacterized protein n=1 Tax=Aphis glycines TaxID=307491 RepID=A0A6G0U9M6_APHGL|nr:hypothetical protein AGLY_000535 [Aphis glycines]
MAPNIFNKNPIAISYSDSRENIDKYYLYTDYLDNQTTEYSEKLDFQQFYNSVFISHYIDSENLKNEISTFCMADNKFIPFLKFKTIYQIMSLGRHARKFRNCITLTNIDKIVTTLKSVYANEHMNAADRAKQINNLLESQHKNQLTECLGEFKQLVKKIFGDIKESDFEMNILNIGKHSDVLMNMAANNTFDYETKMDEISVYQHFYKADADEMVNNVITYTDTDKFDCKHYFLSNTMEYYIPMLEIFAGFDNYNDFVKQSKIRISLVLNNKDLYDLYLANPITIDEYKILRKPIPLYHETMYSIYSLRLQILGYIPLHEDIWTEEMQKLTLIPNWTENFSRTGLKLIIDYILNIEENEEFNYEIALYI